MNLPSPAIVAERGVQRLPRWALIALCAAYVLPGLFGRDPWRNADLTAFGFMASVARGDASWWQPLIAGLPAETGPLPYWLGAAAIKLLPFLDAAVAARLPYAAVLVLVLVVTWYCCFHLARTEAAQPVAFAFGGEAQVVDYARAIADGALLALIASLGLLRVGHETAPELTQLLAISLVLYGLAAAPFRETKAKVAVLGALPMLAASGAPSVALLLAALALLLVRRSSFVEVRALWPWLVGAIGLTVAVGIKLGAWAWRIEVPAEGQAVQTMFLLGWFCWPTLPLAAWTVWRWRRHWQRRHVTVPLVGSLVPLAACILMNGSDRALLLALPSLAVLAAFALPTLRRAFTAAMDWFSLFFFSAGALFVWVYYVSMQTGWPATPLRNLRRLGPGFEPAFDWTALVFATLATVAWLALVRWRTSRHRHPLWKSLVLPAGGVALAWLLTMTLLLPPLDYARSLRPFVARLQAHVPANANCVAAPDQNLATLAALEVHGGWTVRTSPLHATPCDFALLSATLPAPAGWVSMSQVRRPTDRSNAGGVSVLKRASTLNSALSSTQISAP